MAQLEPSAEGIKSLSHGSMHCTGKLSLHPMNTCANPTLLQLAACADLMGPVTIFSHSVENHQKSGWVHVSYSFTQVSRHLSLTCCFGTDLTSTDLTAVSDSCRITRVSGALLEKMCVHTGVLKFPRGVFSFVAVVSVVGPGTGAPLELSACGEMTVSVVAPQPIL